MFISVKCKYAYTAKDLKSLGSKFNDESGEHRDIGVDSESNLAAGKFQIVFSSPEMLFMQKCWIMSDIYKSQLQAVVIDEAHTVKKW